MNILKKEKLMSYLNKNGLVGGMIPANTECPFFSGCGLRNENCPSKENDNLRSCEFSCAAARYLSICEETS